MWDSVPDVVTPMTPLRSLATTDDGGVRVIRDTGAAWLDGSEEVLLERVCSGLALDSLSDELFATATNWPERYHLSPSRANVIRALELPADAAVLEIGAGCGAITRYLGETCATVDALEPTLARARVAAARTADLPGVAVFSGEVSDVPLQPIYDVVVVVGVLEYVGNGSRIRDPYVAFLDLLRQTLRPGGQLVVAIENALGVKYLAGAPEDHSGEVFHSVEGYPVDGPARTFNRRQLVRLAQDAGFVSTYVLGAFPDYKLTRMIYDDGLLAETAALATKIPSFPSPDWVVERPALLDERLLWQQLVDAGVAAEFSNSFVLIAHTAGEPRPLWPENRLASYFSIRRRRPFQVMKTVEASERGVTVSSALLGSGIADGLEVLPYNEEWTDGFSPLELALADPDRLAALVADWVRVLSVRAGESNSGTPFDVLPHNVHYADGVARLIDDEWRSQSASLRDTIIRGTILFARDLAAMAAPEVWGVRSVSELATLIAGHAGIDLTDEMLDEAFEREAELQARVGGGAPGSDAYGSTRLAVLSQLRRAFAFPESLQERVPVWVGEVSARREAIEARDLLIATGRQLEQANSEIAGIPGVQAELDATRAELGRIAAELAASRATADALTRRSLRWRVGRLRRRGALIARRVLRRSR